MSAQIRRPSIQVDLLRRHREDTVRVVAFTVLAGLEDFNAAVFALSAAISSAVLVTIGSLRRSRESKLPTNFGLAR